MNSDSLNFNPAWTLFLDRDGVINERIVGDYVKSWNEFKFIDGVLSSMKKFNRIFGHIVVVTNQQGIGKGLMTADDLDKIHSNMITEINKWGGHVDKVYYCPDLADSQSFMRKPQIGMAIQAARDFTGIDLNKAVMVGDSTSDMEFGRNAGMITVLAGNKQEGIMQNDLVDFQYDSLTEFADRL